MNGELQNVLDRTFVNGYSNYMARPREYDEDTVLNEAMLLFWRQGYEATSVSHLVNATGMAKGSLYQAFGDKQRLFLAALERYLAQGRHALRACMEGAKTGYEGVRVWLTENAKPSASGGIRRGCLAVNTAAELAPHNADVRKVLRAHERKMEQLYEATIVRGMKDGSIDDAIDPAACARSLTTTIYGLQIRSKLGMTREQGRETVAQVLAALTPA